MDLDTLKAAAKAVIAVFKGRGLTPPAMERTTAPSLAKAAGINEVTATPLYEAWIAVVRPDDEFGTDFSTRLVAELEKRAEPEPEPPTDEAGRPQPQRPPTDHDRPAKGEIPRIPSSIPGLSIEDLARAHFVRACAARGIQPHMPTIAGKARRAAYMARDGKLDEARLPGWVEQQVAWLDSKALVSERLESRKVDADEGDIVRIAQVLQDVEGELSDGVIDAITDIVLGGRAPAPAAEEEVVADDPLANGPAPDPLAA